MTTTVEASHDHITIVTTLELPKAQTYPLPSPVDEPMNTADAVRDLYER